MFPLTPGAADLALASPLFPDMVVTLPDGRTLVVHAPQASPSTPYVHALDVSGIRAPAAATTTCPVGPDRHPRPVGPPVAPASAITSGGTLTFGLSATADPSWGSTPADSPPSFATGQAPAVGYSVPSGGMALAVGRPTTFQLGVKQVAAGGPAVHWSTAGASGLTLSASDGVFAGSGDSGGCANPKAVTQTLTAEASAPGSFRLVVDMQTATGAALPPVVVDLVASN